MKQYRKLFVMMIIFFCLTSGMVFAQDATDAPAPAITLISPTKPLMPCPTDVTPATICDLIATQPKDIVGVWSVYFGAQPAFIRYNVDGTWVLGNTAESTAAAFVDGYASGTYSFDENVFTSTFTLPTTLPQECATARYILRVIKVGGQPVALNHAVPVAADNIIQEDCFAPRRLDWSYTMLWAGNGD